MPILSDDFNRANSGTLGSGWNLCVGTVEAEIVNNQCSTHVTGSTGLAVHRYASSTGSDDHRSSVEVVTQPVDAAKKVGVAVRMSATGTTGYFASISSDKYFRLNKFSGTTQTQLTAVLVSTWTGVGDITLQVEGDLLTGLVDDVIIFQHTDSTYATGTYCGFYKANGAFEIDNWSATSGLLVVQSVSVDNFNRANSATLGTDWQINSGSSFTISGNQAVGSSTAASVSQHTTSTGNTDHYVQATRTSGAGWGGVVCRLNANGTEGYTFIVRPSTGEIRIQNFSGTTSLSTVGSSEFITAFTGSFEIRVEVIGDAIKGYINGDEVISRTDSTYTTGDYGGLISWDSGNPFDDFEAGSLSLPGQSVTSFVPEVLVESIPLVPEQSITSLIPEVIVESAPSVPEQSITSLIPEVIVESAPSVPEQSITSLIPEVIVESAPSVPEQGVTSIIAESIVEATPLAIEQDVTSLIAEVIVESTPPPQTQSFVRPMHAYQPTVIGAN